VVPIIPEGREVTPALLNRAIHLEVRNKKEEELLNIQRQLSQATPDLPLDPDLVFRRGHNITQLRAERKSYLQKPTLARRHEGAAAAHPSSPKSLVGLPLWIKPISQQLHQRCPHSDELSAPAFRA